MRAKSYDPMEEPPLTRVLSVAGILGGALWIGLAFIPPEWGPPGSQAYVGYELWNRLWTPALLGMFLGFLGFTIRSRPAFSPRAVTGLVVLTAGLALMVAGNIAEFWIFSDLP